MNSDDDLARAIALSLQEASKPKSKTKPKSKPEATIDLTTDSEEDNDEDTRFQDDLRRAVDSSKAPGTSSEPTPEPPPSITEPEVQPVQMPKSAFLLDRVQMEKERRERQKRLRKEAGLEDSDDEDGQDRKRVHVTPPSPEKEIPRIAPAAKGKGKEVSPEDALYWDSDYRPTANALAFPRTDGLKTFRLSELITHKSEIQFAIISSFSLDISFIYSFFDPKTPVIVVAQPNANGDKGIRNVLPNWVKTMPFLRGGYGAMHVKFLLLFYKDRLRIIITTANLIPLDFRENENFVWVQDVPLRPSPLAIPTSKLRLKDDFPGVLVRTLHALNVKQALDNMIQHDHPNLILSCLSQIQTDYDFSAITAHLVPSVAGKHEGWTDVSRNGHTRLMRVVHDMGIAESRVAVEYQGSSIGQFSTQWTNEFYASCRGISPQTYLDVPKRRREASGYPSPVELKIVYPTRATVKESKVGEIGATTLFCRRQTWSAKKYPRENFCDSKATSGAVLQHTKIITATMLPSSSSASKSKPLSKSKPKRKNEYSSTEEESDSDIEIVSPPTLAPTAKGPKPIGWVYVGSHNFTPSAWGTLSGSAVNPVMNIRNYELGLIIPLASSEQYAPFNVYQRPPKPYALRSGGKEDGRPGGKDDGEPWIQDECEALVLAKGMMEAIMGGE